MCQGIRFPRYVSAPFAPSLRIELTCHTGGAAVARCVGSRLGRRDATDAIEHRQTDEEIQEAFNNCVALLGQEGKSRVCVHE